MRIDWRLGDVRHGGLRERRMFSRVEWYYLAIFSSPSPSPNPNPNPTPNPNPNPTPNPRYYLAIFSDLILRFGWALTLVPGTQSVGHLLKTGDEFEAFWVVALAWVELCRRAMCVP